MHGIAPATAFPSLRKTKAHLNCLSECKGRAEALPRGCSVPQRRSDEVEVIRSEVSGLELLEGGNVRQPGDGMRLIRFIHIQDACYVEGAVEVNDQVTFRLVLRGGRGSLSGRKRAVGQNHDSLTGRTCRRTPVEAARDTTGDIISPARATVDEVRTRGILIHAGTSKVKRSSGTSKSVMLA